MVSKLVPFEFEHLRYAMDLSVPTHWYEVDENQFDRAMNDVNWNRCWYSGCCVYKEYNRTLAMYDDRSHRWYLNPDYFASNLNPKLLDSESTFQIL